MIKISPSVLACDFCRLGEEVEDIRKKGADMVHLDVMDGAFVPNISFGLPVISSLRKSSDMIFDVHLMIDKPEKYVERFIDAGADIVTFHIEATDDVSGTLKKIKERGKTAAISIKPLTPAEETFPYLDECDMVLVMTVEPGFGGQSLIPETIEKVRVIKEEIDRRGLSVDLQVDGGIGPKNAHLVKAAGANILVAGSSVFGAPDRQAAMDSMR